MAKRSKKIVAPAVPAETPAPKGWDVVEPGIEQLPPEVSQDAYISNVSSYTFEHAVSTALKSSSESGGAEAEMVCSLFNDERWTLDRLEQYFGAEKSQRIVRDGKNFTDTSIETRKTIEHSMLLLVPEYFAAIEAVSEAKSLLRFTNKQDETAIARAKIKIKKLEEPILATRQMLHRAFQSLYACRKEGYVSLRIGENGELLVTTFDNEEKPFTATGVRKMGNKALKEEGLIGTRAPRPTVADNAANVSAKNISATCSAMGALLEDVTYEPDTDDINDLAETALRIVHRMKTEEVENDDMLRDTVSQIMVELNRLIGTKAKGKKANVA